MLRSQGVTWCCHLRGVDLDQLIPAVPHTLLSLCLRPSPLWILGPHYWPLVAITLKCIEWWGNLKVPVCQALCLIPSSFTPILWVRNLRHSQGRDLFIMAHLMNSPQTSSSLHVSPGGLEFAVHTLWVLLCRHLLGPWPPPGMPFPSLPL